jgi:pyrroline-5-carboxylate reductase
MTDKIVFIGDGNMGAGPSSGVSSQRAGTQPTSTLSSTGHVFWVQSDSAMDAVTAVSGSGPAYILHFLEGLQFATEKLGFSKVQARELALPVSNGVLEQALHTNEEFGTLRERVTLKGGNHRIRTGSRRRMRHR